MIKKKKENFPSSVKRGGKKKIKPSLLSPKAVLGNRSGDNSSAYFLFKQDLITYFSQKGIPKMCIPELEKVVINVAVKNQREFKSAFNTLKVITKKNPAWSQAKEAIAAFKVRKGDKLGVFSTLRREGAWYFLKNLVEKILPQIPAFARPRFFSFDKQGGLSIGVPEQLFFSGVRFQDVAGGKGLGVNISFKRRHDKLAVRLNKIYLSRLGFARFLDSDSIGQKELAGGV